LDLAQGSSDTTGSYLETFFLYMLHYPDVQEKVFQELQENIPPGQEASFSDYKKFVSLVYTLSITEIYDTDAMNQENHLIYFFIVE